MKKYIFISIILSISAFWGCEEPQELIPTTGNEVGSVTLIMPDGSKFQGASTGNPEDTIFVEVEGSINTDMTRLSMYASIPNNARIEPALTGLQDFTKPISFTVIGADNVTATYTVKALLIPTAIKVTELWRKQAREFGSFANHNHGAIGVTGNYVVTHARTAFDYYNITDGTKAGTISWQGADLSPFPLHMTTDDVGHIISSNFVAAAGTELRTYMWESVTSQPKLLFSWVSDAPGNVGRKIYVKGDLNKLAYIYMSVSNNSLFLRWEVKNGIVTSSVPEKVSFTHPNTTWGLQPKIVPIELGKNSNYFINSNTGDMRITYMDGESNTSLFNSSNLTWLGSYNAFDYVDLSGARYLFAMETNDWNAFTEIFNVRLLIKDSKLITDDNQLIHTRVWGDWWPIDGWFTTNGNRTGDIKALVAPDGKSAIVAYLATNVGVKVCKVELL